MKKFLILTTILLAGFVFTGVRHSYADEGGVEEKERIVVGFKDGVPGWKKANLHAQLEGKGVDVAGLAELNMDVVEVPKGRALGLLKQYKGNPSVKFAEVDMLVKPGLTPNDPRFQYQWHLTKIQCPQAWDRTTGNASVVIAVCDTGVDAENPDLRGKLLPGYNSVDGSNDTTPILSHGTGVALVAAGFSNNGTYGASVSWGSKILPVRITNFPDGGAYFSSMASGIKWAADNGAKVINLSYVTYSGGALSSTVLDAANYAQSKGAIVVIAAGNDNTNPAGNQTTNSALYVSATDWNDAKTTFTNYGPYVHLSAPGVDIKANYNSSYSGTSFAAPLVCGVVSLMLSVNPGLSVADVKQILFSSVDDLGAAGRDDTFGYGRLNAAKAVQSADGAVANQAPVVTVTQPAANSTQDNSVMVTFVGSAWDNEDGDVTSSMVWTSNLDGVIGNGGSFTAYLSAGTHVITVSACDSKGVVGTTTVTITVNDVMQVTAPSNLSALSSGRRVTLNWSDNSSNETGFSVERGVKLKGNSQPVFTVVGVLAVNTSSFTDTVASGGTYIYRVRAFNDAAISDYSNSAQARVK